MKKFLENLRNRLFGLNRLEFVLEKHLDEMQFKIERLEQRIVDLQKHELSRLDALSHLQNIKTLENETYNLRELARQTRDQQLSHTEDFRNFYVQISAANNF